MALLRLNDFDSYYRQTFGGNNIRDFEVYTDYDRPEKVGQVTDALLSETGQFQSLVIHLHRLSNKQVLIPFEQLKIDSAKRRVYLRELSQNQLANLSAYTSAQTNTAVRSTEPQFQETRRTVYPSVFELSAPLESSVPLEASAPLDPAVPARRIRQEKPIQAIHQEQPIQPIRDERMHPKQYEKHLESDTIAPLPERDDRGGQEEPIRLLDEKLIVNLRRRKIGEVIVRKEIETRMVEVPIRHEKLIVEQVSPERQQLASIDFGQTEVESIELLSPTNFDDRHVVQGKFASARIASQFLKAIADQPNAGDETVQVQILITDPQRREMYQQWVEQYTHYSSTKEQL